jgi:lipopolysaccharide transport system permease protein
VTIVLKPLKALWRRKTLIKRWLPLDDSQWAKLNLLKTLVQRDLEARYKGSILGKLWPVLNQVSQLLIYTYVFGIVLKVRISLTGLPEDNSLIFGLWLFAGLVPWLAFSTGLSQSAVSVIQQPNLVKKVVFPLTLLPLVPILSSLIESTFGLVALIIFVVLATQQLHPTLLLLPLVWLTQLCLTAGLGFLTAGLTVFLRDIPQSLGIILNLWFYATPLIYPASLIPQPFQTWIFWINPMAAVGELYRDMILTGNVTHWSEWAVATIISILVLLGGLWCYHKLRPAFADVL